MCISFENKNKRFDVKYILKIKNKELDLKKNPFQNFRFLFRNSAFFRVTDKSLTAVCKEYLLESAL